MILNEGMRVNRGTKEQDLAQRPEEPEIASER